MHSGRNGTSLALFEWKDRRHAFGEEKKVKDGTSLACKEAVSRITSEENRFLTGKEEAEKVQWRRRRRREQTAAYPDYCNTEKARDRGCMAASQLTGKEEAEKVQWRRRRRREQTAAYPDYCNTEKARDRGCMAASQLEMGIKEQKLKISILGLNSQSKLTAKHALNRK
nr:uncharacterized protein LOC113715180 isoform X1 [Coffea arabica]